MQEGIFNEIEYQEFGDTRNPKGFSEDNYNKHNKGKKEMTRISYAKSKRAEQSFQDRIKPLWLNARLRSIWKRILRRCGNSASSCNGVYDILYVEEENDLLHG